MKLCSIENCTNKFLAKGLCNKHYLRMKNHGNVESVLKVGRKIKHMDPKNAIQKNISIVHETGCWIWLKSKRREYGQITWSGYHTSAHRFSYEAYKGKITNNKFVCHSCDNTLCVNPDHLFLGSHGKNMKDMVTKDRQAKGTKLHTAKLKEHQIREIRNLLLEGYTTTSIAKKYCMNQTTISDIKLRRIWKHVI